MPYILFYADEKDCKTILQWLNENSEIAFILPDGANRWKAEPAVSGLRRQTIALWHVPSGSLPLLHPPPSNKEDRIRDPWRGWKELFPGADRSCPYFGPGHPGILWLTRRPRSLSLRGAVGMSSFEWIGSRYSRVGSPVSPATRRFWNNLQKWIGENAVLIPRKGRLTGPRREIWGLPSALASFKEGRLREEDWF